MLNWRGNQQTGCPFKSIASQFGRLKNDDKAEQPDYAAIIERAFQGQVSSTRLRAFQTLEELYDQVEEYRALLMAYAPTQWKVFSSMCADPSHRMLELARGYCSDTTDAVFMSLNARFNRACYHTVNSTSLGNDVYQRLHTLHQLIRETPIINDQEKEPWQCLARNGAVGINIIVSGAELLETVPKYRRESPLPPDTIRASLDYGVMQPLLASWRNLAPGTAAAFEESIKHNRRPVPNAETMSYFCGFRLNPKHFFLYEHAQGMVPMPTEKIVHRTESSHPPSLVKGGCPAHHVYDPCELAAADGDTRKIDSIWQKTVKSVLAELKEHWLPEYEERLA